MRQAQRLCGSMLMVVSILARAQVPASTEPGNRSTLTPPILVEGQEPKYVAPNTLDRIGRIWAPVMINGKGPFRFVLDTSGNSSAVIPSVAERLGLNAQSSNQAKLIGVTGSAVVSRISVDSMEVGELSLGDANY